MNKHFDPVTEETKDLLKEVTAELQECVPAVVLIQELESCIPTDIKDQIELEYDIKGNEAAVSCLLEHLVSGEQWQLKLAEALLSYNINLPDLAVKLKSHQEDRVSKSYHISNESECGNNKNNKKEVSRSWSLPEESKWESILPSLVGPLKQLDQEYPDSWRLLALHLGYSFEEASQLEVSGLNTDSGGSLVNLIHNWLTHTNSDIDTLLIALGKMQNAQEVLNNSQVSEHMAYAAPFGEGNMEPQVGDGQALHSSPGSLHNSKLQNIQQHMGIDGGAIGTLDAKHTSDSNKVINNTTSLDADNNNDLQDHKFSTNALFFNTDAKKGSYHNEAVQNHGTSSSDTDGKSQVPESVSVGMYGKDLTQVGRDPTEYESTLQREDDATLDIPAFNPVPRLCSVLDEVQTDGNLVSPTLTPLLPPTSVIEPMMTPDYSTSPSYSKESSSSSSSSSPLSSSTKQGTTGMPNFYTNNDSSETLLSSPFYGKGSVSTDSSLPNFFSAFQNKDVSPITELSSNTHRPKQAQELNEDDTINQNDVLLENNLPSSSDILEGSDKNIIPDVGNEAKILSEIPSESLKPSEDTTGTLDSHTGSSLSMREANSEQKVYTEHQQITLTDSSPQNKISESITPTMDEINTSDMNELKQSTELSDHMMTPEGGFQNYDMSDSTCYSEGNLTKNDSLTDSSFEMGTGDNVAVSSKDDLWDEVSVESVATVPEGTRHENAVSEISLDRGACASVDQKILAEAVGALDSGFESKCETEAMDSVNADGESEEINTEHISDEGLSKSGKSEITDEDKSNLEKSALEIVDSAIEAAFQLESESKPSMTSKTETEKECLKKKKEDTSKIDPKNQFTSEKISYFVIAAAILSTTLILVHKFWK